MNIQFDREKLKALVLYISSRCEPSDLGATKLHKVLYFSDMIQFAATGRPITGAIYRKRPHGPTCDALLKTLKDLESDGLIDVTEENFFGYIKKRFRSKVDPDLSRFGPSELEIVDETIDFVCRNNSARTISEFSHTRAWEMVRFGEELPYLSAFYIFPSQVSQESLDWAEGEFKSIENARSSTNAVDFEDYSAFRSRIQSTLP